MVDVVLADPGTRTVSQVASTVGVSVRTLQRLFADLVGVSPR